jgi:hypothetical protein
VNARRKSIIDPPNEDRFQGFFKFDGKPATKIAFGQGSRKVRCGPDPFAFASFYPKTGLHFSEMILGRRQWLFGKMGCQIFDDQHPHVQTRFNGRAGAMGLVSSVRQQMVKRRN